MLMGRMTDKALEKAELVIQKDPKMEEASLLKAAVFLQKKESDKARQFLEDFIGKGYTKQDAYLLLFQSYVQKEDIKGGEKVLLGPGIVSRLKQVATGLQQGPGGLVVIVLRVREGRQEEKKDDR